MLKRLYRLILVLLILALALWVVLLNREAVTFNLGNGQTYSAPLGAMVIFVFSAGVLCTALVASLFGFRAYLRERGFIATERKRSDFASDCAKARSLTVSHQNTIARRLWETLAKREPNDVQSRLWLAKTLDQEGSSQEALKVIDSARSAFPGDCEVLFRAAQLNKRLGNKTAAIDNYALVIANQPSEKAIKEARDLSVELGRFADALEYNAQLEKFAADRNEMQEFEAKIRFSDIKNKANSPEYISDLKKLARDFPEAIAPLVAIADYEMKRGNFDNASQALVKAASIEQTPQSWQRAIDLWVTQKQPERALAIARMTIKEATSTKRAEVEICLAKLYLQLGMFSDARTLLESMAKNNKDPELSRQITTSLGRCFLATGQEKEAAELWRA